MQRLLRSINRREDGIIMLWLWQRLWRLSWFLRYRQDSLRLALQQSFLPPFCVAADWPQLWLWLQRLIPWVPWGRKHRCLLLSVAGYNFLKNFSPAPRFVLARVQPDGLHAWVELPGNAYNLAPELITTPLWSYPEAVSRLVPPVVVAATPTS